jgi:hypothetical protein
MADEEHTGSCAVCQRRTPTPEDEPVCAPCRSRVAGQLRDIPALVDELRGEALPDVTTVGRRTVEHADHLVDVDGALAAVVEVRREVLHEVVAGAVAGKSNAPRVQGSREAPVPIRVDVVDLLGPARTVTSATAELAYAEQDDDQVGYLSAATVLDGWCRDWAETRQESTPSPQVDLQCRYLADRLDWALAEHPAVDEFAGELGDLWHTLRRAAGLTMPRPEPCPGVPCKHCDLCLLVRVPGSEYVECGGCGNLLTEAEYKEWLGLLTAAVKRGGNVVPRK